MKHNDKRPVFLSLAKIHLPVTAVLSLAHRGTGLALFFLLPVAIYLLDLSLQSQQGFSQVRQLMFQPVGLSIMIIIAWFFAHHFFAGIRYLLIDVDIGVDAKASRHSAWLVIASGIVAVLLVALMLR